MADGHWAKSNQWVSLVPPDLAAALSLSERNLGQERHLLSRGDTDSLQLLWFRGQMDQEREQETNHRCSSYLMWNSISQTFLKICCKMFPSYVMVILYSEQSAIRYIQVKLDINRHCWQKSKSICSMLCLCLLFNKVILIALLVTR